MAKSIPDRWLPYQPIGDSIPGTRFISFKVPLKEEICNKLAPNERFTPYMLVEKLVGRLGLVIDLTNTNRYYNPEELKRMGVEHVKIYCEGRKLPRTDVVAKFYAAVDDFLRLNPENEKLIGVHCTHGVNRTGYLICRYMIDKLGFQPDIAISAFNKARRHSMERQHYLEGLRLPAGDACEEWSEAGSRTVSSNSVSMGFRASHVRPQTHSQPRRDFPPVKRRMGEGEGHWRRNDRPPPRPPARAGWHPQTAYDQPDSHSFGGYSHHDSGFQAYPTSDRSFHNNHSRDSGFYNNHYHKPANPNDGFQSYPDSKSGVHNYSDSNTTLRQYSDYNDGFNTSRSSNTAPSSINGFPGPYHRGQHSSRPNVSRRNSRWQDGRNWS